MNLHSHHFIIVFQIYLKPLATLIVFRNPERARIFISYSSNSKSIFHGRSSYRFFVGEKHPSGKELVFASKFFSWKVMRKIAEAGVGIHQIIFIKKSWKHCNAPLEVPVNCNPRRSGVPVISKIILKCISMSGARHKSARLIRDRIIRRILKWTKRVVAYISSVSVNVIFSSRRGIL